MCHDHTIHHFQCRIKSAFQINSVFQVLSIWQFPITLFQYVTWLINLFLYCSCGHMNRLHTSPRSPGSFLVRSKNQAEWIFADYSIFYSKLWPALCGVSVKNTKFNWLYWGLCWRCCGLAKSLRCSPQGENRIWMLHLSRLSSDKN